MALSGAALSPLVLADFFAAFPAASSVTRSNPTTGVVLHNPAAALVESICTGVVSALKKMVLHDAYVGVVGGVATPTLTTPVFYTGTAVASFLASMSWTGAYASQLANILIASLFNRISTITSISMSPIFGGGAGSGVLAPVSNPTLAATMTAECFTSMVSAFTATGYFAIDDQPGNGLTPQITAMITGLSSTYGSIVGNVTASIPYGGAASGSALTFKNSGTFI